MKRELQSQRKRNPSFAFAADGVHANSGGHLIITKQILREWTSSDAFDPVDHKDLLQLIHKRQKLMSDAWLTEIGHSRPGMTKGLPIPEALKEAAKLNEQIYRLVKKP